MVVFTVLRLFFGGVFKAIFSDWRVTLAVIVLCLSGFAVWKWDSVQKKLAEKQAQLEFTQKDNEILKKNNSVLADANKQNQLVLDQVKKDQESTLKAVNQLHQEVVKNNKKAADIQVKLEGIKTAPVPLTPYLVEAINGVQQLRADAALPDASAVASPVPTASAPKPTPLKRFFMKKDKTK